MWEKERKRNALRQTRWEHSTWPNQSITLVGRRCDTAVQQHTISQSIGHKHMVTNQWHPEGSRERERLAPSLPVHAWWLHNHTSIHPTLPHSLAILSSSRFPQSRVMSYLITFSTLHAGQCDGASPVFFVSSTKWPTSQWQPPRQE